MNKSSSQFLCLTWMLFAASIANADGYIKVDSNVSYGSVTALDFSDADVKLVYGQADPALQYGLLWLPDDLAENERVPLIVLIHGGCWLNEYDIQHTYPLSTALAASGYAVWSLEYRRSGDVGGGWPGSFDDIRQGIAYTSMLINYPVNLDDMVIMGHSAGGHLALLAANKIANGEIENVEIGNVDAVIGLAAITDIVDYSRGENSCQTATLDFMGGTYEANPAAYEAANPVAGSLPPNTILLHGDADVIVPIGQSQISGVTRVVADGAGHFDWVHPGTAAHQVLLSTLEDLFQK